jgi:phosphoribosylglycinamide formyltransferase 2
VLLLGSGELGKEVAIELMRLGAEVVACDRYANAPAMQVAHRSHVFSMLDADKLEEIIRAESPDLIVPEIEAIATQRLRTLEAEGFQVIPTAEATWLTMDREGIRRLAAEHLQLPTARYEFAHTLPELEQCAARLGFPVVIKPVMSSSGKGQSIAKNQTQLLQSWDLAQSSGRSGQGRVIVEEFIEFESEITLLTVRAVNGTFFCDPIGHIQKDGDYVESWQPHPMDLSQLAEARRIARAVTDRLGGLGVFGVELFLLKDGRVVFSEVSPRPHDTGLVTLATQVWSEFALHARAILGVPLAFDGDTVPRHAFGGSAAFKAPDQSIAEPVYLGVDKLFSIPGADLRIFSKPESTPKRRLAVALAASQTSSEDALIRAKEARACLGVFDESELSH